MSNLGKSSRKYKVKKKKREKQKKKKLIMLKKNKKKKSRMFYLPDDIWRIILDVGIKTTKLLSYKDLCCLSITCKRFNTLASDESLWSHLFSVDFPFRSRMPNFYKFNWSYDFDLLPQLLLQTKSAKYSYGQALTAKRQRDLESYIESCAWDRMHYWPDFDQFEHIKAEEAKLAAVLNEIEKIELVEEEAKLAAVLNKIENIELAETKCSRRKLTAAQYFNLPKDKSRIYERVPGKPDAREKRNKVFTCQGKGQFR